MSNGTQSPRSLTRNVWEILFSLNLGGAAVRVIFTLSFATMAFFSRLEGRIKIFLHMRQTDLVVGHFASWIPTVLAGLFILALLRSVVPARFTADFARLAGGIITICSTVVPPACYYALTSWPEWWRIGAAIAEMMVAIGLALRFQSGRWRPRDVPGIVVLAGHFAFWRFVAESGRSAPDLAGPAGPILGFCAATAWCLYISDLRLITAGSPV